MIHTLIAVLFWAVYVPLAALVAFPWALVTGSVDLLYRLGIWGAGAGIRLAGVRVHAVGLAELDPAKTYIFMSNHVSNVDPPVLIPLIPRRTSVLVKKELFRIPILGRAMRMASLVPVDRSNRDAAIASLSAAQHVLRAGINLTIFIEGTRSPDGRLAPFKKGPFYLAMEAGVPVVPVTIVGTFGIMPKGRPSIRPGTATVVFHGPIDPAQVGGREELMEVVRARIGSALH